MPERTFVYGATILLGANLFNRILGFTYQYLIMAYLGGEAYGLFNMVFPVYMMALVLTTAGIPLAVSKLVAEEISLGHPRKALSIFHLALAILSVSGAFVTIGLYALSPYLAQKFPDPRVLTVLMICAPAVLIVSVASAFRGYFQGLQNMVPTAFSQICEQITRITVGFSISLYFLPRGVEWAAAGLALGMLAGESVGLTAIIFQYRKFRKNISYSGLGYVRPDGATVRRLWQLAYPVTLGRLLSTGLSALDAMIIPMRLQVAGYSAREATALYGQLGGAAFTLLTFPSVFTFALATSLVPAVAEAAARNQFHVVRIRAAKAIRLTIILGLPFLIMLFLFADSFTAFFKSPTMAPVLRILVLGGIFAYVQQATSGVLQGLGKVHLPVIHSIIAAMVRIPLLYILTARPEWELRGTALAYICGFVIMAALNLWAIMRLTGLPLDLQQFVLQPFSAGLGMFLAFYVAMPYVSGHPAGYVALLAGGIASYTGILIFNEGITWRELRTIPWLGKYLPK